MLYSLIEFLGFQVVGTDGDAGKVVDFLFDDETWVCRYLVVDTGGWLTPNEVTIPMICLADPFLGKDSETLRISLTRKSIADSPKLDEKEFVSRKYERELARHYAVPNYWDGGALWGGSPTPAIPVGWVPPTNDETGADPGNESDAVHLRSLREVLGYSAHATDGDIGKVVDFIVGSTAWQVSRIIVDLNFWLPGGLVQLEVKEIINVSWHEQHFEIPLKKRDIRSRSEFTREQAVNVDA